MKILKYDISGKYYYMIKTSVDIHSFCATTDNAKASRNVHNKRRILTFFYKENPQVSSQTKAYFRHKDRQP